MSVRSRISSFPPHFTSHSLPASSSNCSEHKMSLSVKNRQSGRNEHTSNCTNAPVTFSGRRAHCQIPGILPGTPTLLWHSDHLWPDRSCSYRSLCMAGTATPTTNNNQEVSETGPTHPRSHVNTTSHVFGTHRIQKSVADLLSVAVTKTGATELTPHPPALWITAVGFGVRCFLAALVASGALKITRKAVRPRAQRANAAAQIFSASQRLWDLQWRGCRLYPARCRRCSAALPPRCHPQAARRGGWPLHL